MINKFLEGKFIIFDSDADQDDIIIILKTLMDMDVLPRSVRTSRRTKGEYINETVREIKDFIDSYDGAYIRIYHTYINQREGGLSLDYGYTDEIVGDLEPSKEIYFKEFLSILDIEFDFPENDLLESQLSPLNENKLDSLLKEYEWVTIIVPKLDNEIFKGVQEYLFDKGVYWMSGGDDIIDYPDGLKYLYIGRFPHYHDRPPKEWPIVLGWGLRADKMFNPCHNVRTREYYYEDCIKWKPKFIMVDFYDIFGVNTEDIFNTLNESVEEVDSINKDDILICHTPVVMEYSGDVVTKKGKIYTVQDIMRGFLSIKNELGKKHAFSVNPRHDSYYKNWFGIYEGPDINDVFDDLYS